MADKLLLDSISNLVTYRSILNCVKNHWMKKKSPTHRNKITEGHIAIKIRDGHEKIGT